MKKIILLPLLASMLLYSSLFSQNENVKPGIVGDRFTDFTLPVYQGGQLSTADLRGKNIILVIPRGKYLDNAWCGLCQYQYAEFADLVTSKHIREKYNAEIIFLLPYEKDSLKKWEAFFPEALMKIESWKNPVNTGSLSEGQTEWANFVRAHYPKTFSISEDKVPLPISVLIDDKQQVSKGLDLLREEWGGTRTMQNIPAIYIIDKEGIVRFKYISQSTVDRPHAEYLFEFIEKMGL